MAVIWKDYEGQPISLFLNETKTVLALSTNIILRTKVDTCADLSGVHVIIDQTINDGWELGVDEVPTGRTKVREKQTEDIA